MRPYPIDRLRRFSREQARELTAWARSAPIGALVTRGRDARGWLGAPVDVKLGSPVEHTADAHRDGAFCLLEGEPRAGLWLDPGFAAALVERALGGEEPAQATRGPMSDVERGVLAYALARWLGPGPWSVAAVLTSEPPLLEAVAPRIRWPLELSLGTARGRGELLLARRPGLGAPPRHTLPHWIPVEASVVAGFATLTVSDVAGLRVGDAIIPDELWIDAELRGELRVHARRAALTFYCRSDAGLIVEHIEDTFLPTTKGARRRPKESCEMNEETIAKMGDTPVTLHIEVARLELTLGEVASLAVGEIVRTGRKLTGEVTLRAGDRAVARGELVDVEGELGVQITELTE